MNDPELLLLDEPTAGVDTPGESSFYEMISTIHRNRGITIMLVSHDLSMVYRQASWVYALNGVICCEGSPEHVLNADSLREAYGIHVSPYHHHHHGGQGHVAHGPETLTLHKSVPTFLKSSNKETQAPKSGKDAGNVK
jgi:ABC-type Mn2+/Zn2+ transport system ATPase subunit